MTNDQKPIRDLALENAMAVETGASPLTFSARLLGAFQASWINGQGPVFVSVCLNTSNYRSLLRVLECSLFVGALVAISFAFCYILQTTRRL